MQTFPFPDQAGFEVHYRRTTSPPPGAPKSPYRSEAEGLRYRVVYAFEPRKQHYHVLGIAPREFNCDANYPSAVASSAPTRRFEKVFSPPGMAVETTSVPGAKSLFSRTTRSFYRASGYYRSVGEESDLMRNNPELHSKLACVRNLYLMEVIELAKQRFFQPPIDEVTAGSRESRFVF